MSCIYIVIMFSAVVIYMSQPVMPKIVDVLLRNGTELGTFPYPAVYYHIDEQKYYFHIIAYNYAWSFMIMLVIVTDEVMLITYVHHCSGIFAALR